MSTKTRRNLWLAVLVTVALVAGACAEESAVPTTTTTVPPTTAATTTQPSTTTTSTTTTAPSTTTTTTTVPAAVEAVYRPRPLPAFAAFEEIPLLTNDVAYAGPAWPDSLADVWTSELQQYYLDHAPGAEEQLLDDGFVVVESTYRLFQDAYGSPEYRAEPVFVTTDAGYHFVHLAFSKILREVEAQRLLPILEGLVAGSLTAARQQAETEFAGSALAEPADRVVQLFEAAATLLGLDVGEIGPLAQQEVDLALAAVDFVESPITSYETCTNFLSAANCVDYSQMKPRGHYTRSEDLERYFRAMALLGQEAFSVGNAPSIRLGLVAARAIASDPDLVAAWEAIYEPTAFLVGMADDYTPFEALDIAAELGLDVEDWVDDVALRSVGEGLLARREVGIDPDAASIRIMGPRFVIDSYVLDQMGFPNVGTPDFPRKQVSPLDVMAALGSDTARSIQEEAGEPGYLDYEAQLEAMIAALAARTIGEWAATVYDAWLYALAPKLATKGAAYPEFMRNDAWAAKDLQTALGSYAELRHDTILYAKQAVIAEGGDEPEPPPVPRHWVEPDPVAFRRMAAVAALLQDGLGARSLLAPEHDQLLDDLQSFLDRLARLAADELAGRAISDADNDWLGAVGSEMEALWLQSSDIDPATGQPGSDDTDAALIADIARTAAAYLEIGTGSIDTIFVLVPDDSGTFQLASGGVYSYFEFWRPAEEGRLNDEEWRELLFDGDVPDRTKPISLPALEDGVPRERPAWQAEFLVPMD